MNRFVVFLVGVVTAAAMLAVFPATVAGDHPVPFNGRGEATLTGVGPDGTLLYVGTGHATHLGRLTVDVTVVPHGDGTYSSTGVYTAANGDQIFFASAGPFTSPTSSAGTITITGGTGRFTNATGEADFVDVFANGVNHVAETFEGTIEF